MAFEERYRETIERLFAEDLPGFSSARSFCLEGGKRMRPHLLLDAAEVWGADQEASMTAAIAVELLHQYLLVHDDLMDGDELRHDQPTIHAAAMRHYGAQKGMGIAVVIGDYLSNEGMHQLALVGRDLAKDAELVRIGAGIIRETLFGQLMEYVPNMDWTVKDFETFYAFKTAAYSFRLPLIIADLLAGKQAEREQAILEASTDLGIAFQYHDDLIEFTGKKKRAVSGEGGDIWRGKMTIVSRLILDALPPNAQDLLQREWKERRSLTPEQIQRLRETAERARILERVQELIEERIASASIGLKRLGLQETKSIHQILGFMRT